MSHFGRLDPTHAGRLDFRRAFLVQLKLSSLRLDVRRLAGEQTRWRIELEPRGQGGRPRHVVLEPSGVAWVARVDGCAPRVPDGTTVPIPVPVMRPAWQSEGEWGSMLAWQFMELVLPRVESIRHLPRRRRHRRRISSESPAYQSSGTTLAQVRVLVRRTQQDVERALAALAAESADAPDE